jgi:hypothetical protein
MFVMLSCYRELVDSVFLSGIMCAFWLCFCFSSWGNNHLAIKPKGNWLFMTMCALNRWDNWLLLTIYLNCSIKQLFQCLKMTWNILIMEQLRKQHIFLAISFPPCLFIAFPHTVHIMYDWVWPYFFPHTVMLMRLTSNTCLCFVYSRQIFWLLYFVSDFSKGFLIFWFSQDFLICTRLFKLV